MVDRRPCDADHGLLIGLVQGLLIAYGGVPSFVITLGGLLFFRNAAFYINSGVTIAPLNKTFQLLGGGLDGTIGAFWSWVVCAVAIVAIIVFVWRGARRRAAARNGLPSASDADPPDRNLEFSALSFSPPP